MLERIVLRDAAGSRWLEYTEPMEVLVASRPSEVLPVLERSERRVREEGRYAAGFVSYEAAPAFDPAFVTRPPGRLPLACFGVFREAVPVPDPATSEMPAAARGQWRMATGRDEYIARIAAIREQIAQGNTYQVNYTVRKLGAGLDDPWSLFLAVASDAPYAAWIECADHAIVSASPELFFDRDGATLVCRPMKGTAPRGLTQRDDLARRDRLLGSEKDRAENVMIADMLRNDLGRIAEAGSVRAPALWEVEKFRTVWQLTSTVRATSAASLSDVFTALFPCASVTGAPKVASMQLIAALEESPREIYTGAIGFLAPDGKARFSVAIRTAWIDRKTNTGTYGVGSGIVWDSNAHEEYQECLDKAKVLAGGARRRDFELLETLRWTPDDGWFLLDRHLRRLADSAAYFDFTFAREGVRAALEALARTLPRVPARVRVLLGRDGAVRFESRPLPADAAAPRRLRLAAAPVDRGDPFLYHKTSDRRVYEQALAGVGDCDDVLLWNAEREVTESSVANLVVRRRGRLLTPPVECGLLPGTFREHLLAEGKISGARIRLEDLQDVEEIWLVNSVRGWMRCGLIGDGALTGGKSTAAG